MFYKYVLLCLSLCILLTLSGGCCPQTDCVDKNYFRDETTRVMMVEKTHHVDTTNSICIDKTFVREIIRLIEEEKSQGVERCDMYNRLWKDNYSELIYLVGKIDDAIKASVLLLGQIKCYPASLLEGADELFVPAYESSPDLGDDPYGYFWSCVELLDEAGQITIINYGERLKPIDWDPSKFLSKHPNVAKEFPDVVHFWQEIHRNNQ